MSLPDFAAHCRRMAVAEHKPECHAIGRDTWGAKRIHPNPNCLGCNLAPDQALFARLADEVDDYLAGPPVMADLFGDETPEPPAHRVPDPAELDATTERQTAPTEAEGATA